jgi:hypothetical protein
VPTPIPDHHVPAGPLAVRWHAWELPAFRAGALSSFDVDLENAGAASWSSQPGSPIYLGYHWLDLRGNAIVWAGAFIALPHLVAPRERITVSVAVRAPTPPGRYRLALDLVAEGRAWFSELGNHRLERDVDVGMRLVRRALQVEVADGPPELVRVTNEALAEQEEPIGGEGEATAFLAAGCRPARDWSRRVLDAHAEGFAAVGGSVSVEGSLWSRRGTELAPWKPGFGRSPGWTHPLICPSLLPEALAGAVWLDPRAGLPTLDPEPLTEPWLCDGRIAVAVSATALPRAPRRSA